MEPKTPIELILENLELLRKLFGEGVSPIKSDQTGACLGTPKVPIEYADPNAFEVEAKGGKNLWDTGEPMPAMPMVKFWDIKANDR